MAIPKIINHVEPTYTQIELTGAASQSVPISKITADTGHSGNLTEVYDAAGVLQAAVSSNGLALGRKLSSRYELKWIAGVRGKPGINADIQNSSEAVRMIADPDFEILGTSADTTVVTHNAEGGIKLTTKTSANDQVIILPHLDTSQSGWTQITWGTDQQTDWECHIKTGSAVTAQTLWAGLKLTNTSVVATDDDQVFFRYDSATNSGKWEVVYSIGGTDSETDAGLAAVTADTEYHFRITIDSSRIARMYINGALVKTTTALTNAVDLIPYVGVQTTTTAAKHCYLFGQAISRKYA